jgi:putative transposase
MPRQGRIDFPGALHHVIARGINRSSIFQDDYDRKNFIIRLKNALEETKFACLAWSLIPNHAHLLLRTGPIPLSDLMRRLLTGYALSFNRRHNRVGYLFQDRYKSILCEEEIYLLQLVRYIHLNPLRAKLVTTIEELNTYPWCGHTVLLGNHRAEWQDTEEILSLFGATVRDARNKYLQFVIEGLPEGTRSDLTGGGLIRSIGGWERLNALRKSGDRWRGDERILGSRDFVQRALDKAEEQLTKQEARRLQGWDLNKLLRSVQELCGVDATMICGGDKDRASSRARALFSWWAREEMGIKLTDVASFLHIDKSAVSRAAKKGKKITEKEAVTFPTNP